MQLKERCVITGIGDRSVKAGHITVSVTAEIGGHKVSCTYRASKSGEIKEAMITGAFSSKNFHETKHTLFEESKSFVPWFGVPLDSGHI